MAYVYIIIYIYSDILSGICSDILSGIYSDILSGIYSGILSGIFPGIHSAILSGIYYDILSDILSGILTGYLLSSILSGMSSRPGALHSIFGWRYAVRVQAWSTASGAGRGDEDDNLAEEEVKEVEKKEELHPFYI